MKKSSFNGDQWVFWLISWWFDVTTKYGALVDENGICHGDIFHGDLTVIFNDDLLGIYDGSSDSMLLFDMENMGIGLPMYSRDGPHTEMIYFWIMAILHSYVKFPESIWSEKRYDHVWPMTLIFTLLENQLMFGIPATTDQMSIGFMWILSNSSVVFPKLHKTMNHWTDKPW